MVYECNECGRQQKTHYQIKKMINGDCNACYKRKRKHLPPSDSNKVVKKQRPNQLTPYKAAISIGPRQMKRRLDVIDQCITNVSAPPKRAHIVIHQSRVLIYAELMKRHRSEFEEALVKAGMQYCRGRMSAIDGVQLKGCGGAPWEMIRWHRTFFAKKGFDVWPIEKDVRALIEQLNISYESGIYYTNRKLSKPYIHILSFWPLLRRLIISRHQAGLLHWWPGQSLAKVTVCIGIDKGGLYTKILMIWMNHRYTQTEDASFMLGIYEGDEEHDYIAQVFGSLMKSFNYPPKNWIVKSKCDQPGVLAMKDIPKKYYSGKCDQCKPNEQSFPFIPRIININHVEFVYGGDMMAMGTYLGIGAPSSTHPCLCCEQTNAELGAGSGQLRTLQSLIDNHIKYAAEENKKKPGVAAAAMNVINDPLVFTDIIDNIVPLPLHIIIGIVNRLYSHLEDRCREWDTIYSSSGQTPYHDRWLTTMKQMKVRMARQYGGQLTGDACYRYISQSSLLSLLLTPINSTHQWPATDVTWCTLYQSLVDQLCIIHQLIMRPTPLCEHEIKRVNEMVVPYLLMFQSMYSTVTPKVHMLAYHLPSFLLKHHTVMAHVCVCVCGVVYVCGVTHHM